MSGNASTTERLQSARMELALERGKTIQACYDANGIIYQVALRQ